MKWVVSIFALSIAGAAVVGNLTGQRAPNSEAVQAYTFRTLLDDRSISDNDKWIVFQIRRADWGMCSPDEELTVRPDKRPVCRHVPIEFVEIKQ